MKKLLVVLITLFSFNVSASELSLAKDMGKTNATALYVKTSMCKNIATPNLEKYANSVHNVYKRKPKLVKYIYKQSVKENTMGWKLLNPSKKWKADLKKKNQSISSFCKDIDKQYVDNYNQFNAIGFFDK